MHHSSSRSRCTNVARAKLDKFSGIDVHGRIAKVAERGGLCQRGLYRLRSGNLLHER